MNRYYGSMLCDTWQATWSNHEERKKKHTWLNLIETVCEQKYTQKRVMPIGEQVDWSQWFEHFCVCVCTSGVKEVFTFTRASLVWNNCMHLAELDQSSIWICPFGRTGQCRKIFALMHASVCLLCMTWLFLSIRLAWPSIKEQNEHSNGIFDQKRLSWLLFGFKWNKKADSERRHDWPEPRFFSLGH